MKRHMHFFSALLSVILLSGCAFVNISLAPRPAPLEETTVSGEGKAKILLIDVSGIITSREKSGMLGAKEPSIIDRVKEEIEKARKDRDVKGLIVRINSPGGTVTASDILHHELKAFRDETGVPVYAVLMNVGASGGYYVALSAEKIYAHPTTITGSIGVIAVTLNVEGLMKKIGVEEKSVKSAEMKDIFSPLKADTPEEQAVMQGIIDHLHALFVEKVSEGRGKALSPGEASALADGRPYTARQALDARLIDEVGYMEDAIGDMEASLGIEEARIVTYLRPGDYKGTYYSVFSAGGAGPFGLDYESLLELGSTHFMYLWGVSGD